jgi:type IV pilus assembly protein PilY1
MMSNYPGPYLTPLTTFVRKSICPAIPVLLVVFGLAGFFVAKAVHAEIDLADAPMFTRIQPPPANIMILLDDSGSMDWEFMTDESGCGSGGGYDGLFECYYYIFDDPGDNNGLGSVRPDNRTILSPDDRKKWKSQWSGYNRMYYNPRSEYPPWPTKPPADTVRPRSHPHYSNYTLRLADEFTQISGTEPIRINNAHYYTWDDANDNGYLDSAETVYLVNFVSGSSNDILSARQWYRFVDDGDDVVQPGELTVLDESDVPAAVRPNTFADDLQNFANWYSFYRRRDLTATAAVANFIDQAEGLQIGLYSIQGRINVPVRRVNVDGVDDSAVLLENLYSQYRSNGGTPLRRGLQNIGEYYHQNDNNNGGIGVSPFASAADGGECQLAFAIVITDGYYNGSDPYPSVGNADDDMGAPYEDSYRNTLADVAMYYYVNDLATGLADAVPISPGDHAEHQHMVTYAVSFGVNGTLNPPDYDLASGVYPTWPDPDDGDKQKVDDLWHATVNGRGQFFSANNPQQLVDAFNALLDSISARHRGSAASVTINGDQLYAQVSSEILVFQASYSNYDFEWTGDVKAFRIDNFTGEVLTANPVWSAAATLDTKDPDARNILTYNGENAGLLFLESQLTDAQSDALGSNSNQVASMVAYLRGQEISGYRVRSQKLADIVHSAPIYYNGVVYVGANDGMLHAFDSRNNGEEIFAYIPNLVFSNLSALADPAYTHKYYVDLSPVIKQGNGIFGGNQSQTILVGGLRKGGKGYFALDVSEPFSMNTGNVKWEFPNLNTPEDHIDDMGYSYSRPVVVQSYSEDYPWVVIFGNGYNSENGNSVLFILDPSSGRVIKKIEAGLGPDNGLSTPIAIDVNLDSKVDFVYAGDLKGNLWKFDLVSDNYAQWDIAYKEENTNNAQPLFQATGPNGVLQPITAKPDVSFHPAEHGMLVFFGTGKFLGDSDYADVSTQSVYAVWDYGDPVHRFGQETDREWSDNDDSEYLGMMDRSENPPQLSNQPDRVSLLQQIVQDYTVTFNGVDVTVRVISGDEAPVWITEADSARQLPNPSSEEDNNAGWYYDLSVGERVVGDLILRDGKLISIGFIPDDSRCGHGGNSFFMEVNANTGGGFNTAIFDINDDGSVGGGTVVGDSGDYINIGDVDNPNWVPPVGIMIAGQVQPPAIVGLLEPPGNGDDDDDDGDDDDGGGGCREVKILSSSTGDIHDLKEVCASLGVVYWKEVQQY